MKKITKLLILSIISLISFSSCSNKDKFDEISFNKNIGNQIVKDAKEEGIIIDDYEIKEVNENDVKHSLNITYRNDDYYLNFYTLKIEENYYLKCLIYCYQEEGEKCFNFFYLEWCKLTNQSLLLDDLKTDNYSLDRSELVNGEFKVYKYIDEPNYEITLSEYASYYTIECIGILDNTEAN